MDYDTTNTFRRKPVGTPGAFADETLYKVGERQRDRYGNVYELMTYDPDGTGITLRRGIPVGRKTGAPNYVTADFSDSSQDKFVGLLCAIPTPGSTNKVWVLRHAENIARIGDGGAAMTLTASGIIGLGDAVGWVGDDKIGSHHVCRPSPLAPHPFDSWDMGVAGTGTTLNGSLAHCSIGTPRKTELPPDSLVTLLIQNRDWEAGSSQFSLAGDADLTKTVVRSDTVANTHKLLLTPDGDANDEASIASNNKPFLFATGKRIRFSAKITYTDSGGTNGGFIAGFSKAVASGSADLLVDTSNEFAAAAVLEGMGVGKETLADLHLNHFFSNGTAIDTNDDESLHTIVSGTEFEVLITGTPAAGGILTYINGVAAGVALDGSVAGAEQLYAILYGKCAAGQITVAIRDAIWAVER